MKNQVKPTRRQTKTGNAVPNKTPAPRTAASRGVDHPFPIGGIGASAGGLEALELFLRNVLPNSGMAFVIVQHLDPTHKGIMVELLQRVTAGAGPTGLFSNYNRDLLNQAREEKQ